MNGCIEHKDFNPACHWCHVKLNTICRMTDNERKAHGITDEMLNKIKQQMEIKFSNKMEDITKNNTRCQCGQLYGSVRLVGTEKVIPWREVYELHGEFSIKIKTVNRKRRPVPVCLQCGYILFHTGF